MYEMDEKQFKALLAVLDYLKDSEESHYRLNKPHGCRHVWQDAKVLVDWCDKQHTKGVLQSSTGDAAVSI